MLMIVTALLLGQLPTTPVADSLFRTRSSAPVAETVTRLRAAAESRGLTVFAVVDHAANAQGVDLALAPSVMVMLGNPRAGTLLMQCDPLVAVELPLRMLVWQDSEGRTWVGHTPVSVLGERYHLEACRAILERIAEVLTALRQAAAQP